MKKLSGVERIITAIVILALLATSLWLYHRGVDQYDYATYEPRIITESKVEVVIVEIETIVTKEVPVRYYAREFQDFKQLTDFIKSLDLEATRKSTWDCDDYAYYLWTEAIRAGFLMSFESEVQGKELHALNNTVIGNTVYFIDLQAKKIWTRGWLD